MVFKPNSAFIEKFKEKQHERRSEFAAVDPFAGRTCPYSPSGGRSVSEKFFAAIPETVSKEDRLEITDFGTFTLTRLAAKDIAPAAKERNNALYYKLRFSPAEALKNAVNKPFSYFERVLLNEGVSFEGVTVVEEKEKKTAEEIWIKIDRDKAFALDSKVKQKTKKKPIARWMPL